MKQRDLYLAELQTQLDSGELDVTLHDAIQWAIDEIDRLEDHAGTLARRSDGWLRELNQERENYRNALETGQKIERAKIETAIRESLLSPYIVDVVLNTLRKMKGEP